MEILSNEYGWTPSQIRNMRVDDIQNYLDIIATRNQLEQARNKRNGVS